MIASLTGTVVSVALDHVVLEVGGIGYAVRCTPTTLAVLRRGESATLATSLVVREDSLTLYGFADADGKVLFELVQSVSGVGPKIALALLAVHDPESLRTALASGDTVALTRAPGIGKKGAERLVLELKDKVGQVLLGPDDPVPGAAGPAPAWREQLLDALGGLGFSAKQAADAIDAVTKDADDAAVSAGDVAVLLRRALTHLGRHR